MEYQSLSQQHKIFVNHTLDGLRMRVNISTCHAKCKKMDRLQICTGGAEVLSHDFRWGSSFTWTEHHMQAEEKSNHTLEVHPLMLAELQSGGMLWHNKLLPLCPFMEMKILMSVCFVLQKLERTAPKDCFDTTLWAPMTTSPHTGTSLLTCAGPAQKSHKREVSLPGVCRWTTNSLVELTAT